MPLSDIENPSRLPRLDQSLSRKKNGSRILRIKTMNQDTRNQQIQREPTAPPMSERERIAAGLLANGQPRVKSFGAQSQKLAWPPIPGYVLYWANNTPGRIDELKGRGYDHVTKDGQNVERIVGTDPSGAGLKAYLLKIPQEWYDLDQSAAQSAEAEKMQRIKTGNIGVEGSYVPNQGISIARR